MYQIVIMELNVYKFPGQPLNYAQDSDNNMIAG